MTYPILKTSGRIAICISGEQRTAMEALPSFLRFFGKGHDVFIHCWRQERDISKEIKGAYSPVSMVVEPPNPDRHDQPFSSMLYSMMRANDLKRDRELYLGKRYDCVIKTRFDLVFNPSLEFPYARPEPRTLSCVGLTHGFNNIDYGNIGIDDTVFWGDSIAMDVACHTYMHFAKSCKPMMEGLHKGYNYDPGNCFLSPGILIYQTSVKRNVMFRWAEGYDYVIMRKHAKHLDAIRDYERIKELCKWWKP